MSTCNGKCCAVFVYPSTPGELRARWEKWPNDTSVYHRDDLYIADMLVPLTSEEAIERAEQFDLDPSDAFDLVKWAEQNSAIYTCKHFDGGTRKCTAYDERPRMCAEYPYSKTCSHSKSCSYQLTGTPLGDYITRNYPAVAVIGAS